MSTENAKFVGLQECRQSYWSEIDEKEKCNRLRQMVKCLQEQVVALDKTVNTLLTHQHSPLGELLTPMRCNQEGRSVGHFLLEQQNDVYF